MVYFFLSAFLGYGHHQRVVAHLDSAQYTVGFQLLEQGIYIARVVDAELIEERLVKGRGKQLAGQQLLVQIVGSVVRQLGCLLQAFLSH